MKIVIVCITIILCVLSFICCYALGRYMGTMHKKESEMGDRAISEQAVLELVADYDLSMGQVVKGIHNLPSVNPQEPKWVPVSEKLPENRNQEVLISLEWGIDIGRYSDGEWHSEWINHYDDGNVIAWMPLPTQYEP